MMLFFILRPILSLSKKRLLRVGDIWRSWLSWIIRLIWLWMSMMLLLIIRRRRYLRSTMIRLPLLRMRGPLSLINLLSASSMLLHLLLLSLSHFIHCCVFVHFSFYFRQVVRFTRKGLRSEIGMWERLSTGYALLWIQTKHTLQEVKCFRLI